MIAAKQRQRQDSAEISSVINIEAWDFDGCFKEEVDQSAASVRDKHKRKFKIGSSLLNRLSVGTYLCSVSGRQSARHDKSLAVVYYQDGIRAVKYFKAAAKQREALFTQCSLADIAHGLPAGTAFRNKKWSAPWDEFKLLIYLMQIHYHASFLFLSRGVTKPIVFNAVDDRSYKHHSAWSAEHDITGKLARVFERYPYLIPKRVMLGIHFYAGLRLESVAKIEGRGPLLEEPAWRMLLQYLLSLSPGALSSADLPACEADFMRKERACQRINFVFFGLTECLSRTVVTAEMVKAMLMHMDSPFIEGDFVGNYVIEDDLLGVLRLALFLMNYLPEDGIHDAFCKHFSTSLFFWLRERELSLESLANVLYSVERVLSQCSQFPRQLGEVRAALAKKMPIYPALADPDAVKTTVLLWQEAHAQGRLQEALRDLVEYTPRSVAPVETRVWGDVVPNARTCPVPLADALFGC